MYRTTAPHFPAPRAQFRFVTAQLYEYPFCGGEWVRRREAEAEAVHVAVYAAQHEAWLRTRRPLRLLNH